MSKEFNLLGVYTYADLLETLQAGAKLCNVVEYRDGTKHLDEKLSADAHYIRWNNYGSSANKATARNMEFVVTRIFKTSIDDLIRRYVWVW